MIDNRATYSGYDKIFERVIGIIKKEIPNGGDLEEIILKNIINKLGEFETEIENIVEGRKEDGNI